MAILVHGASGGTEPNFAALIAAALFTGGVVVKVAIRGVAA